MSCCTLYSGLDNDAFIVPMSGGKDKPTEKCQHVGILISSLFVYFLATLNKMLN